MNAVHAIMTEYEHMTSERWREVFRDAALQLKLADVELDETGSCSLRTNQPGMPDIHILFDAERGVAEIVSELGMPPDADRDVCFDLLCDNFLGDRAGGAVFAASRTTGQIVLQRTFPAHTEDDGEALAEALADFAEVAWAGRRRIYRSVFGEGGADSRPSAPLGIDGFLRI